MKISSNHILDGVIKSLNKKKTNVEMSQVYNDQTVTSENYSKTGASHCLPTCLTVQIQTATLSEALQKKKKENLPIYQRLFKKTLQNMTNRRWPALAQTCLV